MIKGTQKIPTITFSDNVLTISGRSIPENAPDFYKPIEKLVDNNPNITLELKLEYLNTSSSVQIYGLMKKITKIKWYYETDDDDMLEMGEDYSMMLGIKLELISVDKFDFEY